MKPLTYRQLKEAINELLDDDLDQSVLLLDLKTKEVRPAYETILVSELPGNSLRREVEDKIDLDAPVITM